MHDCTAVVQESQPDWLTCSTGTTEHGDRLQFDADRWLRRELDNGAQVRPFRLLGFTGYAAGRVRFAKREHRALLQLSGDLAAEHLPYLTPWVENISRLDLAVTAKLPALDDTLSSRHYEEALAYRAAHPRAARARLIQDGDNGSTLYIGDRTSDLFLRCYNKQRECENERDLAGAAHYAGCWRYELEVKGPSAKQLSRTVAGAQDTARFIQSAVHEYCSQRGIDPVFAPTGSREIVRGFRRRSDRESRLDWLGTAVRPAVDWLKASGDEGLAREILGLE